MERERNNETEWKTTEEAKVKQQGTGIKNNRRNKSETARNRNQKQQGMQNENSGELA